MKTALVLACDDNFVAYSSVVARRVAQLSSEKFPIVIISDGVSDENKRLAQKFCSQISFIEASHLFGDLTFFTGAFFTRAAYLRLFFDEILADFDRVAYIDSDVSPLTDPSPLLQMVPKVSPIMGTHDLSQIYTNIIYDRLPLSREAGYLQTGVLVFDLKAIREERIFKDAIRFALDYPEKCELVEQDALNVALQGRWQVIDWRWNVLNFDARYLPKPFYIRHHGGPSKPWSKDKTECEPYAVKQWWKDLANSPWPYKFVPERKGWLLRKYVRPITRAVEVPIKAAIRGDFETILHGEKDRRPIKRYLQLLPSLLRKAEEAAREGRLAAAL
jgi:lipopolysaccharide biosynthesis glycosyltransferase